MKMLRILIALTLVFAFSGCDLDLTPIQTQTTAASGVVQTQARVQTQADGKTVEQQNVANRLLADNKVGSIKHLYVFSAYSGQCLIYSTVKGKVTSSGKRLHPSTQVKFSQYSDTYSPELLQDDGTYGSSFEYIYWWDTKGIYHQHYIVGGQIVHISDQPMPVKSVTINMELNS